MSADTATTNLSERPTGEGAVPGASVTQDKKLAENNKEKRFGIERSLFPAYKY